MDAPAKMQRARRPSPARWRVQAPLGAWAGASISTGVEHQEGVAARGANAHASAMVRLAIDCGCNGATRVPVVYMTHAERDAALVACGTKAAFGAGGTTDGAVLRQGE
jgi:hypothetical protein